MVWRSKKSQAAVVVNPAPPPEPRIVHNHGINWGLVILTGFACLVVALLLLWWIGVFLLTQAGVRNPERTLASAIITLAIGLPVLWLAAWLISGAVVTFLDRFYGHRETMRRLDLESLRYRALTAGNPAPGNYRLTDDQKRLFETLCIVMERAYRDYARSGFYRNGNVSRPWSKQAIVTMPPPPRHGPLPYSQVTKIREWLAHRNIIIGAAQSDQINIMKFPTWEDFRALIEDEFNLPVVVGRALPYPGHSGYEPIEE
ncbi:MAG: hypothetical protein ACREIQ_06050 [Nitrospiria bacterium]